MTTIKLLSTGLIAIAMLTTTAVARENFAAGRTRVIIRGAPCYMGNSAPPPAAGLSGTAFQYGSVRRSGACPATFATRATMRGYAEMRRIGGAPPTAAAPPRSDSCQWSQCRQRHDNQTTKLLVVIAIENAEVAFDNEPGDQDGDAGDAKNCGPAFVSGPLRFCRCPVAGKTSSTEHDDEGQFDPKLRGRHRLNKVIHFPLAFRAVISHFRGRGRGGERHKPQTKKTAFAKGTLRPNYSAPAQPAPCRCEELSVAAIVSI